MKIFPKDITLEENENVLSLNKDCFVQEHHKEPVLVEVQQNHAQQTGQGRRVVVDLGVMDRAELLSCYVYYLPYVFCSRDPLL